MILILMNEIFIAKLSYALYMLEISCKTQCRAIEA